MGRPVSTRVLCVFFEVFGRILCGFYGFFFCGFSSFEMCLDSNLLKFEFIEICLNSKNSNFKIFKFKNSYFLIIQIQNLSENCLILEEMSNLKFIQIIKKKLYLLLGRILERLITGLACSMR
jgi:hypothetical protein